MSVALVLVSHSRALADGVRELAAQMAPDIVIVAAGGADDGGLGTSFDRVSAALTEAAGPGGVVVLYDLGSALLTTETALEFLADDRIDIVDAPLVEGAVAAAVSAQGGADRHAVAAAARGDRTAVTATGPVHEVTLRNPLGLHARPAAELARVLARFDAEATLGRPGEEAADVASVLAVLALGARGGETLELGATGPQAGAAVAALADLIGTGFGES